MDICIYIYIYIYKHIYIYMYMYDSDANDPEAVCQVRQPRARDDCLGRGGPVQEACEGPLPPAPPQKMLLLPSQVFFIVQQPVVQSNSFICTIKQLLFYKNDKY